MNFTKYQRLYYELNCVPSKFIWWSPNCQCDILDRDFGGGFFFFWRGVLGMGHMRLWGWSPHDGIWVSVRRDTAELALLLSVMWAGSYLQARKRFSPKPIHTGTLALGFYLPEPWENNFLLFKYPGLWLFCYGSLSWLRHYVKYFTGTIPCSSHKISISIQNLHLKEVKKEFMQCVQCHKAI